MKIQNYELRTRTVAFMALLFVLPGVLFYAVGARSIEPINGQDGYAYIGIVARTSDFLSRFPDSYFGTRFGYIFPSDLFHWMFGFEVGHHLMRFVILGTVAVLFKARGRLRNSVAIVVVVLFSISPIVLVSTFSTYTMSVGAIALLLAVLLFAMYDTGRVGEFVIPALSSAVLAIAWNSHLQLLLPSVVIFAILLCDRVFESKGKRLATFLTIGSAGLVGASITCLAGVLLLGTRYGIWNPWAPALEFTSGPSNDLFKSDGFDWITWRHYVLLAPIAIVTCAITCLTERDPFLRRILRRLTLVLVGLLLVYIYYQWVLRNIGFETFYHSSGFLTVCVATLALSVGVLLNRDNHTVAIGIAVLTFAVIAYVGGANVGGNFLFVLVTAFVILITITVSAIYMQQVFRLSILSLVGLSAWITVSSPHDFPATPGGYRTDPLYDTALFSYDKSSMDRASVVNEISLMIPSRPSTDGEIRIWFNPSTPYDQLSAPFLWYKSALQAPNDPPPPAITPTVERHLSESKPRFIAVIDGNMEHVSDGIGELTNRASYRLVWKRTVTSGSFSAHVAFLELNSFQKSYR